jgi:hypothetical protein
MINLFFFYGSAIGDKENEFYVQVDDYDIIPENEGVIVKLDGIATKRFQALSHLTKGSEENAGIESEYDSHSFEIRLNNNLWNRWQENIEPSNFHRKRWIRLKTTTTKTPLEILHVIDSAENPEIINEYASEIEFLGTSGLLIGELKTLFSLDRFTIADAETISREFTVNLPDSYLNVYNVGQGSCNAIVNSKNVPITFLDVGGGWGPNNFTYPNALDLCTCSLQSVIISHWDKDHVETLRRYSYNKWSKFTEKKWLAPAYGFTPFYHKLAVRLATTGKLFLLPQNAFATINCGLFSVIPCTGTDKNGRALAIEVNTTGERSLAKILFPSDAGYVHIPGIHTSTYKSLVATHHGAEFPNKNFPVPITLNGNIAYSYGLKNTYLHPKSNAEIAHLNGGLSWTNRLDSPKGNISFKVTDSSNVNHLICPCKSADMNVVQTF